MKLELSTQQPLNSKWIRPVKKWDILVKDIIRSRGKVIPLTNDFLLTLPYARIMSPLHWVLRRPLKGFDLLRWLPMLNSAC